MSNEDPKFRTVAIGKAINKTPFRGRLLSAAIKDIDAKEKAETGEHRSHKMAIIRIATDHPEIVDVTLVGFHPDGRDLEWETLHHNPETS